MSTINNFNFYVLIQTHTSFNIVPSTPESSKKPSSNFNLLLTKLVSVYHLNSFMLLLTKLTHVVTLVKNSPWKILPSFTIFLTCLYGSLFSFMIALNANQTNTHLPIKPNNISPLLLFYENATHFNYRIFVDTKGPISPSSQRNKT